jgi:hypothetical protein
VLDLQQHEYLPGHLNAADILSRSPGAESYENDYESTEQFVCYVAQNAVPKAMTIAEIQEASHEQVEEYVGGVCAELPVFVPSV